MVQRSLITKATNTHENNLFRIYFFPRKQALRGFFLGFIQILKNSSQGLERNPYLDLAYKCGENRTAIRTGDGKIETVEVKDEDRYCFYVAQSSAELRTVGSEMHNCVGWCYTELARKKYCTIVYAKYKNKYRICIEVSPKFSIRQALGPGNRVL